MLQIVLESCRHTKRYSFRIQTALLNSFSPFFVKQRRGISRARFVTNFGDVCQKPRIPFLANNSALLARKGIRGFLVNLAKVGNKARSADAASLLDEESRNELIGAGLIRKEYLLVCRQDSRTICSIPDRDEFESTIGQKLTCTSCGRLFVDELIQDIYALTPSARSLLEGSHWMTLWVTSLLVNSGVQGERIKWNAAAGDDELDIVAEIHGLKVFFELKDREFGLGDAYPFSFRIERYGGDVGVVVTTESVADEADKFFEEQKRRGNTVVSVVDGEKDIPQKLTSLVASLSKLAVRQSVAGAEERFGFDIWPIPRRMDGKVRVTWPLTNKD